MASSNFNLGMEVHEHLVERGVETPAAFMSKLTPEMRKENIERSFSNTLQSLGMDLKDDSIQDTPKRVAEMYQNEICYGLDYQNFPDISAFSNRMNYDELLIEKDIKVHSMCEHHLVPFIGTATVAYMPNENVVGLSKLNRVVDFFSRRPQVQERLTLQVAYSLQYLLNTETVAVIVDAEHLCVKLRGVKDHGSSTITSFMGGDFRTHPSLKQELLSVSGK